LKGHSTSAIYTSFIAGNYPAAFAIASRYEIASIISLYQLTLGCVQRRRDIN